MEKRIIGVESSGLGWNKWGTGWRCISVGPRYCVVQQVSEIYSIF